MNTIKTWQERAGLDRHDERPYMRAEIEELRAALEAARATPAQPVPTFEVTEIHGTARVNQYGDEPHITGYHERTYTIPSQPSPSSVGAAIRALPLPEPWIRDCTTKDPAARDHFAADQVRDLLSEAAALAEQVQANNTKDE